MVHCIMCVVVWWGLSMLSVCESQRDILFSVEGLYNKCNTLQLIFIMAIIRN